MPARAANATHSTGAANAMRATYRMLQRKVAEMLSEEGLTQPQFQALRIIARVGPTPMKGLSFEMLVTPANITGIIDRLESKQLVERMALQGDRRATIIGLTPKGRKLQERVATRYTNFMERALRALTADEQTTLIELLVRLQKAMSHTKS